MARHGYEVGFDELYQQVLTWDLYDLIEGSQLYKLGKVATTYPNVDAYLDAFEPLLLEEARAQLERARQEDRNRTHRLRLLTVEKRNAFFHAHFERPADSADAQAAAAEAAAEAADCAATALAGDAAGAKEAGGAPSLLKPPNGLGPTIAPSAATDFKLESEGRDFYDGDLVFISHEPLNDSLTPAKGAAGEGGAEGESKEGEQGGKEGGGEEPPAAEGGEEAAGSPGGTGANAGAASDRTGEVDAHAAAADPYVDTPSGSASTA
ncbi:hypothetical protein T492DRAFT_849330 [Pavlovales sp. CCMP2436]|nr:hypothetical protein T492DRAFT_849330 [Pavlovales sp. CCMP2436]